MKAILFSISVVILGLALLSTVILISRSGFQEQNIVSRVVVFNRMQDEIEYVSRELISIINIFNITVSVNGNTVSITEDNPFPNRERFEILMDNWKEFTESNSDFNLTVNVDDIKNTLPLKINDQVEYRHTNGVSGVKITVENASLVANYTVLIIVKQNGNITFDWGSTNPGNQNFTLTVKTNDKINTTSKKLDFSKGNELDVNIKTLAGGTKTIDIGIGKGTDTGFFKMDNQDKLNITLVTNITLNTGDVKVTLPDSIINITSSLYNISRVTTVKVG